MPKDIGAARPLGQESAALDEKRRRSLGIYYTPHSAAQILARWVIRHSTDIVLEPSFGGCALLSAAVSRLRDLGCSRPARQLHGYDVDRDAFSYLTRLLGGDVNRRTQFALRDFLRAEPENNKHITGVIANPPYVSWHRMNAAQRVVIRQWRDRHCPAFPMTASLWAYFLAHAISFLAPGGRLAFVLPASALSADYAKPVLRDLAHRFRHCFIFRLNEQLFIQAGAREKTVLLLAEHRQDCSQAACSFPTDRKVASLADLNGAITSLLAAENSPCIHHSPSGSAELMLDALVRRGNICTLGDAANVAIGEVVGDTSFLVKTTSEWEALGIDAQKFNSLITRTRQLRGIRISPRDVTSRYSAVPRLLAASSSRVSKRLQRYLESYSAAMRRKNITFAKRTPWYAVSYDTTAKAFIGSLSHDAPRIVLNTAHVSCANGLYKISRARGVPWRAALAIASLSTVTQLSAELLARARGSGALKLEPSDVRHLALPVSYQLLRAAVAKHAIHRIDTLLRAGEKEAAVRAADDCLLVAPGVTTSAQLTELRSYLQDLRDARLRCTR